jgi:flotillin
MIVGIVVATLIILIVVTLVGQLISKMRLVPPSELGVVHGRGDGFKLVRGGREFVLPLINRFDTMDLKPQTTSVVVESAIARGIVPLTVTATVSFAVAHSEQGLINAVKRILHLTDDWTELRGIANSIIEGHLRDSIAAMTPEEVMSQKDQLIQHMIRVAKSDLEEIGLEITTMNIADVDDHRLEGVDEPDLYIALLKRVQTANAETQSRMAKAEAIATATEEQQERRADVEVRALENERQQIDAETRVHLAEERQRAAVGMQQATRNAESETAGILAQIEAEKQRIEMVTQQLKANVIVPAEAQKVRKIEDAKAQVADVRLRGQAELDQLRQTIEILESGDGHGATAYLIEVFDELVARFANAMDLFPVEHVSVIAGRNPQQGPISAIHPNALDAELTRRIGGVLGADGVPEKQPSQAQTKPAEE